MDSNVNEFTSENFAAVKWNAGVLTLLDQRKLPNEIIYLDYDNSRHVADAIRNMVVRGAPAIGIAAAYAVVLVARLTFREHGEQWPLKIRSAMDYLANARPTAVNLHWAIGEMQKTIDGLDIKIDPEPALLELAQRIHQEDIDANHEMGRLGAELIKSKCQVMTHCNGGALATGGYGTALGVIRSAFQQDLVEKVFASETRPWLQGARLTSWELRQDNIPVSLMIDSALSSVMRKGEIKWFIVGSDRIAANGDVANKIGTYSHAVAAKYHGVKVMVVAPASTVDMSIASGDMIPIEDRSSTEITEIKGIRIAPADINIQNPAFDITPAELVDFIVTEKGVIEQPNTEKMLVVFG